MSLDPVRSRRQFLRLVFGACGAVAGSQLLSACGGTVAPAAQSSNSSASQAAPPAAAASKPSASAAAASSPASAGAQAGPRLTVAYTTTVASMAPLWMADATGAFTSN